MHEMHNPGGLSRDDLGFDELQEDAHEESRDSFLDKTSDYWSFNGTVLVRHHLTPRTSLFMPDQSAPIPLKWIDVHRLTVTSITEKGEKHIEDYWDGEPSCCKELSEPWVGATTFQMVQPAASKGLSLIHI